MFKTIDAAYMRRLWISEIKKRIVRVKLIIMVIMIIMMIMMGLILKKWFTKGRNPIRTNLVILTITDWSMLSIIEILKRFRFQKTLSDLFQSETYLYYKNFQGKKTGFFQYDKYFLREIAKCNDSRYIGKFVLTKLTNI